MSRQKTLEAETIGRKNVQLDEIAPKRLNGSSDDPCSDAQAHLFQIKYPQHKQIVRTTHGRTEHSRLHARWT